MLDTIALFLLVYPIFLPYPTTQFPSFLTPYGSSITLISFTFYSQFFFSSLPLNCLNFLCSMRLSFFVPSTDILVLHLYFLSIVLLHFCSPIPFYSFSFWVFILFVSFTFCFSFFLPSFKLWVSFTMIIISPKDNCAYG